MNTALFVAYVLFGLGFVAQDSYDDGQKSWWMALFVLALWLPLLIFVAGLQTARWGKRGLP